MSITVPTFDEFSIKRELRGCSKELRDYVKALHGSVEMAHKTTGMAMKKIRELSQGCAI